MCVFFFSLCAGDSVRVLIGDFSTFSIRAGRFCATLRVKVSETKEDRVIQPPSETCVKQWKRV